MYLKNDQIFRTLRTTAHQIHHVYETLRTQLCICPYFYILLFVKSESQIIIKKLSKLQLTLRVKNAVSKGYDFVILTSRHQREQASIADVFT